ncbi:thioredoxin domain-containing protein [Microbacterium sp.]|uniref:DsbA family protein n=2 Tax=unclassified Microbacterium TaxID=2609290 RepID=UPI00092A6EAB|nr:thioredoxin domain-containing protein [Microbacterium sp.]MBN9186038.1 thioredoxin domain-containing protein [Microbacterium sp.]MBN9194343.1 thioredoxin domain-containing protein [Microbacterium sp.]OJU68671.1 MAG: protein-disulfide isomerase [Microbacterium sp. 70-38]
MSSDESPNVPEPKDRREAVREKAQQVQAKQSRARVARRTTLIVGIVVVVGLAGGAVAWAFQSAASRPELSPSNVANDGFQVTAVAGVAGLGGQSIGNATPTPTPSVTSTGTKVATPSPTASTAPAVDIRVYVDYYAPGAKQFQLANAQQLTKWVSQDAATLSYYPVAMLSAKSNGTKYSLRAASASACVATYAPDSFFAYNNALLTQQPDQGSDGLTDAQLADLAIASGADSPKVVRDCIENEDYVAWAKSATDRALKGLPDTKNVTLTGTPMILVNGTPYVGALDDPKEFAQFVLTISSDSYYKTATPTPTPTPSATK